MFIFESERVTSVTLTGVTVTVQVAVYPPSADLTVIVAVPTAFALIKPDDTVATVLSLDSQYTTLFAASDGYNVAVNCFVKPAVTVTAESERETPVTLIG